MCNADLADKNISATFWASLENPLYAQCCHSHLRCDPLNSSSSVAKTNKYWWNMILCFSTLFSANAKDICVLIYLSVQIIVKLTLRTPYSYKKWLLQCHLDESVVCLFYCFIWFYFYFIKLQKYFNWMNYWINNVNKRNYPFHCVTIWIIIQQKIQQNISKMKSYDFF